MHAHEVALEEAQEFVAPQEHAIHRKKRKRSILAVGPH